MSGANGGRRFVLVLAGAFALAWGGSAALAAVRGGGDADLPRKAAAPPTAQDYASSTLAITGELTEAARAALAAQPEGERALLVVLEGRDWLTCEDLGRQLRELNGARGTRPLMVATDSASAETVRSFLRRERVRAPVVALGPQSVLVQEPKLRTPAVLVVHDGLRGEGVSHTRRFANTRIRSFAEEMETLLD